MSRLQKKCFIASAGTHLVLVLILFIGPGFISSKSKPDDLPILDFIPLKTTDALVSGGGNRNGHLPAPPPAASKPPEPVAQPQHMPESPKPVKTEQAKDEQEQSLEPSPRHTTKKFELKPVKKSNIAKADNHQKQVEEEAKARKEDEARRRELANRFDAALGNINNGVSAGIAINPKDFKGPGASGIPYANFLQAVKSVYARAWVIPDGVTDDDAAVDTTVTIARDGSVVSWRMLRASGSAGVDQSVRVTMERVKFAAPLPDDSSDSQRTVPITFSVRAKRSLG